MKEESSLTISEVAYIAGLFDVSGHVACYKKKD